MEQDIRDRPVWHALSGLQSEFSLGYEGAGVGCG
jgi:hypothetical protein